MTPAIHDRESYDRGRREAFLELRRLALAGVGSTQPDANTRLLLLIAEHCAIAADAAAAGGE